MNKRAQYTGMHHICTCFHYEQLSSTKAVCLLRVLQTNYNAVPVTGSLSGRFAPSAVYCCGECVGVMEHARLPWQRPSLFTSSPN